MSEEFMAVDDDFGGFNSGEETKPIENGNHHQAESHDDDDFGDFASPHDEILKEGEDPTTETQQHSLTDSGVPTAEFAPLPQPDDDFGDFGSAPDSAIASTSFDQTGENETENPENEEQRKEAEKYANYGTVPSPDNVETGDDDFGDFDSAEDAGLSDENTGSIIGTETATEKVDNDDDFVDFGSAEPTPNTGGNPDSNAAYEEYFGDLGGAENGQETTSVDIEADNNASNDDFGDFGSAEPTSEATTDNPINNKKDDDSADDFGDFGSAEPTSEARTDNPISNKKDDDGADDFGDFGSAEPTSEATTDNPINNQEDDDGADDFGDFGSARATPPGDIVMEAQSSFDDGAFGDFSGASANHSEELKADGINDEFGDFTAIETKQTEESFGDFNDVPSSTKPAAEDDDDFGDFDSAQASEQTPKQASEGDDGYFGNFSSFKESTPAQSESVSTTSTSSFNANFSTPSENLQPAQDSDPVLQKARSIFSKVFQQYRSADPNGDSDSASAAVSVAALISSTEQDRGSERSENPVEKLKTILNETKKDPIPSLYIVSEGNRYRPNEHFSVSIGEDFYFEGQRQRRHHRPQMLASSFLPQNTPDHATNLTKDDAIVDQLSDKCRQLLQQIPDLSFMLQTKLMLPKK